MRDRQPTQPGRVLLTPENGDAPFYAIMEMADEPTELGTPPTKANLLTDETETALFGSAEDRTVNQAFAGIAAKINLIASGMVSLTLTVKDTNGNLVSGVKVSGMYDDAGGSVYTNDSGVASGYIQSGGATVAIDAYLDIVPVSATFTAEKGESISGSLVVSYVEEKEITSSGTFMFSPAVSDFDVCAVGGGGGGGGGGFASTSAVSGGGGGGGGHVINELELTAESNVAYTAAVGAGGSGGYYKSTYGSGYSGGSGGTTSLAKKGETIISAPGGSGGSGGQRAQTTNAGGTGNGAGGSGSYTGSRCTAGVDGSIYKYGDASLGLAGGGGGGGGGLSAGGSAGGVLYGGAGGGTKSPAYDFSYYGEDGQGPGGGGGGGTGASDTYDGAGGGGSGYRGTIYLRWRFVA